MTPGKIVDYDKQFTKNLDESRNRIDLSTTVGKNIDNLLTPLYKRFGFVDNITHLVDMNAHSIPLKDRPFKHSQVPAVVLAELGVDIKWFETARKQKDLPTGHKHELAELTNHYLKASQAIQHTIKKLHFECNNSGNLAWDVFGALHWVTDFAKELDKLKYENKDLHMMHENEIVEALKKRIYQSPKKIISNMRKIAEEYKTDVYTLRALFEKQEGISPREYSTHVLDEGLGDYVKHAASNVGNKFLGKFGVGQAKVAAKAKVATASDMNNVLNKWTEITHGDPKAATPDALKNFLTRELSMDPTVVDASLSKFNSQFIGGNKQAAATNPLGNIKARNQAQPQVAPAAPAPAAAPNAAPTQAAPAQPAAQPTAAQTQVPPAKPTTPKITPAQAKSQARKELGNFAPGVDKRAEEILATANNESVKKPGKTLKEMSNAFNTKVNEDRQRWSVKATYTLGGKEQTVTKEVFAKNSKEAEEKVLDSLHKGKFDDAEKIKVHQVKQLDEATDYLPKNALRDFFLDALKTQKMAVLGSHVQPVTPAATPNAAPTQATPAQPATPQPATAKPVAPGKPTPANFAAEIAALPANQRAAAISQALVSLTDDEIKQVLQALVTPKSKKP